ncbi:MAG: biotin/lipoyl-binding protein [Spirochaetia bacterium]|nr:biotin/lipoyl-binding protein [Spirochaetia bacterium]
MKKRVDFMVTAFRDGFQSVYGARVFTKDFMPAVEAASRAGIRHFEAGGGARFQSLYFYGNEDAFDMMDEFRRTAGPNADLQTLARGVNVVGLDSQPRDIINLHAKLFKKHGISTIRNFDALNDVNNLIYSGQCIVDAGLKHEVTVTMMALPPGASGAHDPDFYEGTLRKILDAGITYDSVCFKDASGTSTPKVVFDSIKRARKLLGKDARIVFHSHETAGVSIQQYMSAIEAGANQVDLSMAPVSGGTCQPDVITMWHALRGTEYDLGIDIDKIMEAEEVFKECMADYFLPPEATMVNPLIPFSPLPGGALTANTQMLRDNGLMDRYHEITMAMGEAIERGGFGTSVTPVSQFYFQQAFNNVMFGPWKKIAEGYGKMVLGYFGKTPLPPDPEIVKLCQEQLGKEPTTKLVVDINDADPTKGIKQAEEMLKKENLPITDENIFIAAACKEKGIQYLKGEAKIGVRKIEKKTEVEAAPAAPAAPAANTPEGYTVTVNNTPYGVKIQGDVAIVNGVAYSIAIKDGINTAIPQTQTAPAAGPGTDIKAPMPGLILRIVKQVGDTVADGELVLVMEAMKMETEIFAPCAGTVTAINVSQGDQKTAGAVLAVISPAGQSYAQPAAPAAPAIQAPQAQAPAAKAPSPSAGAGSSITAPMPGLILRIEKQVGDTVAENELVLVMEAMKMETEIFAPCAGTIASINVAQGDQKKAGDLLAVISQA